MQQVMDAKHVSGGPQGQTAQGSHDTLSVVQRIIAEVTGNDIEDITLDADLEEDLGVEMLHELPLIVLKIQKELDVKLSMAAVKDCATVAELVELIDDEREL